MEANKIEIKTLSVSILGVLSIELVATLLISPDLSHPLAVLGVARLLETILLILVVSTLGGGLQSIGLSRSKMGLGLKRGLIWSAGFGIVASFGCAALFLAGINPLKLVHTRLPAKPGAVALFFLIGGLVGPTAEEVFFRGVLYGFFRRWGVVVALVLSTLLFVLAHAITGGIPVTQLVGGILFAVAYEVEGILIVPITMHCLGNMAIFILSLVT